MFRFLLGLLEYELSRAKCFELSGIFEYTGIIPHCMNVMIVCLTIGLCVSPDGR
jgi:hypothetical protein